MTGWRLGWMVLPAAALDAAGKLIEFNSSCAPVFVQRGALAALALARRLVAEHGLGLAPGAAFGEEGEGWLRWCFASREPERLDQGLLRLRAALGL